MIFGVQKYEKLDMWSGKKHGIGDMRLAKDYSMAKSVVFHISARSAPIGPTTGETGLIKACRNDNTI